MKQMKILRMTNDQLDELWDGVGSAMADASAHYDEMLYDLDDGDELNPTKRKALSDSLDRLRHKLEVFRTETDV